MADATEQHLDNQEMDVDDAVLAAWNLRDSDPVKCETVFREVLNARPNHRDALRFFGVFLSKAGRYHEAITLLKRCIAYNSADAAAWCDLGAAYSKIGDYPASIAACNRALEIAPNMPSARYNRATPLLCLGDWENGWKDYEYGKVAGVRVQRFLQPEWCGWSPIEGKTVYVWAEQGFGDQIMGAQLIPILRERFKPARVILEVNRELVALMQGLEFVDEVVAQPDDRHEPMLFDEHVSLMSLPAALSLKQSDLPGAVEYIKAPAVVSEAKVGLCLRGSPAHHDDANRSVFDAFELPVPYVELGGTKQAGMDWLQTAQIIAGLDLVITVDTGVVHLAGAMGVEAWVLVPKLCDYRWGQYGSDVPQWYPRVIICQQDIQGDWKPVFSRIWEQCALRYGIPTSSPIEDYAYV